MFARKIAMLKPDGDPVVQSVQYNLPKANQNADDALCVTNIRMKPSWTISPGNSNWIRCVYVGMDYPRIFSLPLIGLAWRRAIVAATIFNLHLGTSVFRAAI